MSIGPKIRSISKKVYDDERSVIQSYPPWNILSNKIYKQQLYEKIGLTQPVSCLLQVIQ